MVRSSDPETKYGLSPSEQKLTEFSPSSCPTRVKRGLSLAIDHTLIEQSREAEAKVVLSRGFKSIAMT